jgi:hypothetical protein
MSVDAVDGVISLEFLPPRLLQKTNSSAPKSQTPTSQSGSPAQAQFVDLPTQLQQLYSPTFPLNFGTIVDDVFEHLLNILRTQSGEQHPSQRTVAQMFNITRHEASQRLARGEQHRN